MSGAGPPPRKLWDWRLVTSLAVLLSVVFVVTIAITGQRDSARKSDQIARLVAQNADDTRQFNRVQQHLLDNQHETLAYTAALAARQTAILAYLSRRGVQIPRALLTPITPPVLTPAPGEPTTPSVPKASTHPPKPSASSAPKAQALTRGPAHLHAPRHPHQRPRHLDRPRRGHWGHSHHS